MSVRVCKKRGRGALLARSLQLLLALEARGSYGLSLREASEICGHDVSVRTIKRDLQALCEVFPIKPYQGKARYRLDWSASNARYRLDWSAALGGRRLLATPETAQ